MNQLTGYKLIFQEIMEDSPLGREKLKRLWPELSIEAQMQILAELINQDMLLTPDQLEVIYQSSHSVIQQLAIRHNRLNVEEEILDSELEEAINNNLDSLVRYSRLASFNQDDSNLVGFSYEEFSEYSYEHQLALLAGANAPCGEMFVSCIRHMKSQGKDERQITGLIEQYSCNSRMISPFKYVDCTPEHYPYYIDSLRSLWLLICDLPKEQGKILARKVATENSFQQVAELAFWQELNRDILLEILKRKDVGLIDLRKKIIFDLEYTKDTEVLESAVSENFNCSDDDLAALLDYAKSEDYAEGENNQGLLRLMYLAQAELLTLPQMQAIHGYFTDNVHESIEWLIYDERAALDRKIKRQSEE